MKKTPSSQNTFQAAYSIRGKGVGHLELEKALQSKEFTDATKKLAKQIKAAYGVKTVSL
ncbi:hypothetical protein [uncultured Zhongshania sp.]|uniref:hypothetical protein n=1 Tax=uncultured Zhongshania sp. TaxID=1642288 RepID=UPI0030D93F0A|tara:strand:+ start:596 stop:772 length:177 start_codon:yes stop_codon:yes gene_type:complete